MHDYSGRHHSVRRHRSKARRIITGVAIGAAAVTAVAGAGIGAFAWNNTTYDSRDRQKVRDAGYVEHKRTLPSGTTLNYAEGPDNGPAVLLLHAQSAAWQSYARVLPQLAENFQVYAIDIAGHGRSDRTPGRYDIDSLGEDAGDFTTEVIGQPVVLSGHSSGGLIAAWLAERMPDQVRSILFEDPPFFSTDPERMPQQFNFIDLARPSHEFLGQRDKPGGEKDFPTYYMRHNAWLRYFGDGRTGVADYAATYRSEHPDEPLRLWFLPPTTNQTVAHLHRFDPEFADAFYRMTWQEGFDQAATLSGIRQPTILVHANWKITDAGILEGAMTDADADRACALPDSCRIERVDTGHGFHFEDPDRFVQLLQEAAARARSAEQ